MVLTYINSSRLRLERVNRRFATKTDADMLVLDAGAGHGPYRELFDHARYEAADFAQLKTAYTPLDYVCDLSDVPVDDDHFDRILFNQVLEHVPDPRVVLAELHRVLKPGGRLLCTCPLFYEEHQKPYDYYRYTKYALRMLFEEAGFEVERLEWMEGYFGTVAHQFHQMYRYLPTDVSHLAPGWRRRLYLVPTLWVTRQLAKVLRVAFARAEMRWKHTKSGMPKNYMVIARKPTA